MRRADENGLIEINNESWVSCSLGCLLLRYGRSTLHLFDTVETNVLPGDEGERRKTTHEEYVHVEKAEKLHHAVEL